MQRQALKRRLVRKKIQAQQKRVLLQSPESKELLNIIDQVSNGKQIYVPDVLVSLEKFCNMTSGLVENQITLYAERELLLGACLNSLKKYRDKVEPKTWGVWASTNIPFIKVRKREMLMRLSQEPGVDGFTYLGISALNLILEKIENLYSKGKYLNRFEAFFSESTYPYKEYKKTETVKKLVVVHFFEVKAKRENLTIDTANIIKLAEYDGVLNDKLVEDLLQVEAAGGSSDKFIEILIMGRGKAQKRSSTNDTSGKQLSLDRATTLFKDALKYYLNNFHKLDEVEMDEIAEIAESVDQLYWEKLVFDVMQ